MEKTIAIFIRDVLSHKNIVVMMFSFVALAFLLIGVIWPMEYSATTTISIDDKSIIDSLVRPAGGPGRRDTGSKRNMAQELLFSRKIMDKILEYGGWMEGNPSALEQEEIIQGIEGRTTVGSSKDQVVIEYRDSDPERTFMVTSKFAELFISESTAEQIADSQQALDFIEQQVATYHKKLVASEKELEGFKSKNPDVRAGSEREIGGRIDQLGTDIDEAKLQLRELEIKKQSLVEKLSGEKEIGASEAKEKEYLDRMAELRSKLDELQLTYTDAYPDIISLKSQIKELENAITANQAGESIPGATTVSSNITSPLYQELRSQLSETETEIATLRTRIQETDALRKIEMEKAKRIHAMEATLAELTRDYAVEEKIYEELLRRKEDAAVSHVETKQGGLKFKIQEPAMLPIAPVGIRFMHFALAGLFMGIMTPLGLMYVKSMLDPRIRLGESIGEQLSLPVIACVPEYISPGQRRARIANAVFLYAVVIATLTTYGVVSYMKLAGTGSVLS